MRKAAPEHRKRRPQVLPLLRVVARPALRARGWLSAGPRRIQVTLGRGGIRADKREGDGATPRGLFRLRRLWWRADRGARPCTLLPVRRIRPTDGWCEDPNDRRYNRPVARGPTSSADRLWRADRLYDLLIELDHNTRPCIPGRGSAVFIHIMRPDFGPTAGCVALTPRDLRLLLGVVGPKTRILIR